ncbi:hypothetical protein GCM10010914_31340 [Deinococcus wulumuqiensis]|uniref:Uncharacterized protein n=2 Tax=Deinococcus wulumuqiensis TaxID=980427 RepID=A0AAV4K961_9DEIO|nr:hypothetical protein GCM10008021_30920 [Deinococcus wulumuqiensis]GGI94512.1 hypothetical protein GCM10010914_31340 [Deinococcus wulumuqiensis]
MTRVWQLRGRRTVDCIAQYELEPWLSGKFCSNSSATPRTSTKWSEAEALEYVMTGIVPPLGPQANWSGLGQVGAMLTLTFRAPVTRDEVIEAYDQALSSNMFSPVKARRLSIRHQAVLQLVHDMPDATWGERLKRYEEWRKRYPELPAYRGSTAQQAIRTDYRRALERADWQDVTGTRGDTVYTP